MSSISTSPKTRKRSVQRVTETVVFAIAVIWIAVIATVAAILIVMRAAAVSAIAANVSKFVKDVSGNVD